MSALLAAILVVVMAAVAGCGDDPLTSLIKDCEAPEGTVPFRFDVAGYQIAGLIDLPEGPGPHPAVMLIHDSGPTDVVRGVGDFAALRAAFDGAGIATVVWDKAGTGCSAGRYRGIADLYRRADEVVAAVDALGARRDIDADRIGLFALGQGAWVAPMAAVRSEDLAYLIAVGAPGGTPVEQRVHVVARNLELEGYSAAEIDSVTETLRAALTAMAGQATYREYVSMIEPLAGHPFVETLMELATDLFPSERQYDELRGSGALDVDAGVFLAALDLPVLAIWGDLDSQVDVAAAEATYREAFAARRAPDLAIARFAAADHELCRAQTGSLSEARERGQCTLAEGYLESMVEWLRARGFVAGEPTPGTSESTLSNAPPEVVGRR